MTLCQQLWQALVTNWPLVLVGLVGIVVANNTLKEIARQALSMRRQTTLLRNSVQVAIRSAKATSKGAKAAQLSAEAVINSERPWLVVTARPVRENSPRFELSCLNQGNTPAKIVSASAANTWTTNPENLPIPPDYAFPIEMPDLRLIVKNDSFAIGKGLEPQTIIRANNKTDLIQNSLEFFVYYGNVVYQDTLYPPGSTEGRHETRWCFIYLPHGTPKLLRSGPEEYNRYT